MTILKAVSKFCLLSFLILININNSTAQGLIMVPLESNPKLIHHTESQKESHARNNQVCTADTLTLPFFDDFARQESVYPDCQRWQDNHVFLNFDMAHNPPSAGVATFEGLSYTGLPYNMSAGVGTGSPADTLTSQHLNLDGLFANDDVYLSFYIQKQGLGDRPEVQDSFFLEFKDSSDTWVRIWSEGGVPSNASSLALFPFEQKYVKIDSGKFLYNGFQFRFRNLASITGNNDHWHLDYVMLDENRGNNADTLNVNYGRYADVAFTHRPTPILKNNYTAMPWRHFVGDTCWADSITIRNYNHNATGAGTLDRRCNVDEINPNANSLLVEGIPAVASYTPSPNLDDSLTYALVGTFGNFNPTEKTVIKSTYTILNPSGFQNNPIFFENDTVYTKTILDNYFAYDDGTAETRVIAQGVGTKIAVEFKAEIQDTIQGVYFHLPYYTNNNSQNDVINIKVWMNNLHDSSEVFSRDLHSLEYKLGFNGFYFVDLVDFFNEKILVPVEAGQTFYVGWQQSFGTEVPVGFDRSTNNKEKTFIGTGGTWNQSTLDGTIMIRPLLSPDSNYTLIPTQKIEKKPVNQLTVYPNPTKDIINLDLDFYENVGDYQLYIHNAVGQEMQSGDFVDQLNLSSWNAGLYVLTLRDEAGTIIAQQKIIKH